MRQENYEEIQETKVMIESHKEKGSEEVQTTILQLKEMIDVHKDVSLPVNPERKTVHKCKNRRLRHRLCLG
jgi:hypothetical protein